MAKQSAKLNNFSGGIDLATAERDIEADECVGIKNLSLYRPGLLFLGHKAIEYLYNDIPGITMLGYSAMPGSGYREDAAEGLMNQSMFQFAATKTGAHEFAACYNNSMVGCNTTMFDMDSDAKGGNKIQGSTGGYFYDTRPHYGRPYVNWVSGNELPKPGRSSWEWAVRPNDGTTGYVNEWARWEYEAGWGHTMSDHPATESLHVSGDFNYPPPKHEFIDCAWIQKPQTTHSRTETQTINTQSMMSLRWDRMLSGPRGNTTHPSGSVMSTNDSGPNNMAEELDGRHPTRLMPGTWYRCHARVRNTSGKACKTFGLAYDQTFLWNVNSNFGHIGFPAQDTSGDRVYDWLDPVSYTRSDGTIDEGDIKFNITSSKSTTPSFRFRTKDVLDFTDTDADGPNGLHLHQMYFNLCFSKSTSVTVGAGSYINTNNTGNTYVIDAADTVTDNNFEAKIIWLCLEIDSNQNTQSHTNYSGYGDEYTLLNGGGHKFLFSGGIFKETLHGWMHSRRKNKWTNEAGFEHTWKLGLFPNYLEEYGAGSHASIGSRDDMDDNNSGQDGIKGGAFRKSWLNPDHRVLWRSASHQALTDYYYINGGLRAKDLSSWNDHTSWLGYVDNEMYKNARDYWWKHNSTYNGDWDFAIGTWRESAWFLERGYFPKPKSGRFFILPQNIAERDGDDEYKLRLNFPLNTYSGGAGNMTQYTKTASDGTSMTSFPGQENGTTGLTEVEYKGRLYKGVNDLGSWFPCGNNDMLTEASSKNPDLSSNGHDINVKMQHYAKGWKYAGISWPRYERDYYGKTLAADLKSQFTFGISYLYDGEPGDTFEMSTRQETGVTSIKWPMLKLSPNNESSIQERSSWVEFDRTYHWKADAMQYVQPFRFSWTHGPRQHRTSPRLSGFRVYIRDTHGTWGDWMLLMHVDFLEGMYTWYGQDKSSKHPILEMKTQHKTSDGDTTYPNPAQSHPWDWTGNQATNNGISLGNAGNDASGGYVVSGEQDIINNSFDWNYTTSFGIGHGDYRQERPLQSMPKTAGGLSGNGFCRMKGARENVDATTLPGTFTAVGERWCTSEHPLEILNTTDTYKALHQYEPEAVDARPRYKCSINTENRTIIGNVYAGSFNKPSSIIVSPMFKYDTFPSSEYISFESSNSDDEIIYLMDYLRDLVVLKRYSVHVVGMENLSDLKVDRKHLLENNGVRSKHQCVKLNIGCAWINAYGLWYYNGSSIENVLEKELQVAEQSVKKKRIPLPEWQKHFDKDDCFLTYDSQLNQLIASSGSKREVNSEGNPEPRTEFIYDFTTKGFTKGENTFVDATHYVTPPTKGLDGKTYLFASDGEASNKTFLWDNTLSTESDNIQLITKDIDFKDPSRRKKFYRLYVTFKSNNHNAKAWNTTDGSHESEYYINSKMKLYYALDGSKDWQEFDFKKSKNYSDLGSSTSTQGEHGLVVWEDKAQALGNTTLLVNMNTGHDYFFVDGDQRAESGGFFTAGSCALIEEEAFTITRLDYNYSADSTKCFIKPGAETYYNMDLGNGRGINTENPNVVDPAASYPTIVKQHLAGAKVYVFSSLWNQAVLVPKSSDTRKNSFYSIQFKVESVKTSDETRAKVPSKFSINDINVIYREKGLR